MTLCSLIQLLPLLLPNRFIRGQLFFWVFKTENCHFIRSWNENKILLLYQFSLWRKWLLLVSPKNRRHVQVCSPLPHYLRSVSPGWRDSVQDLCKTMIPQELCLLSAGKNKARTVIRCDRLIAAAFLMRKAVEKNRLNWEEREQGGDAQGQNEREALDSLFWPLENGFSFLKQLLF